MNYVKVTFFITFLFYQHIPAFEFLDSRSGSVSGGMGNISACSIGNADSADQNPAAITGQNMKIQIAGSINPNPDAMTVLGGSIGFKPLTFFAVGISMNGVNYGSMTGDVMYQGDEGRRIDSGDVSVRGVVGLVKRNLFTLPINIHAGISGKYAASRLDDVLLSGFSSDMGIIITADNLLPRLGTRRISKTPTAPNTIYAGLLVRNVFSTIREEYAADYADVNFIPGAGYSYSIRRLFTARMFFDYETAVETLHLGAETALFDLVYLRAGTEIAAGNETFTFGGGIRKTIGLGLELAVNYTIVPSGFLGTSQTVGISVGFGQPRHLWAP